MSFPNIEIENLIDEAHDWLTRTRAHVQQGNHANAVACMSELEDTLADLNERLAKLAEKQVSKC